ncbi:MAG: EamA family transporter, partial [Firmicutes bacterium]|nr:EamA family transporter [Bacillota bacterium]
MKELSPIIKKIKKLYPFLSGLGASIIFGFSFLFTKEALDSLAPYHLLGLRFLFALLLLTVLLITGIIKLKYRGKKLFALGALTLFQPIAYMSFETAGINLISSSEAGIMIALIPIV